MKTTANCCARRTTAENHPSEKKAQLGIGMKMKPAVQVKDGKYQATKKELEEKVQIPVSLEELAKAVLKQVEIQKA